MYWGFQMYNSWVLISFTKKWQAIELISSFSVLNVNMLLSCTLLSWGNNMSVGHSETSQQTAQNQLSSFHIKHFLYQRVLAYLILKVFLCHLVVYWSIFHSLWLQTVSHLSGIKAVAALHCTTHQVENQLYGCSWTYLSCFQIYNICLYIVNNIKYYY